MLMSNSQFFYCFYELWENMNPYIYLFIYLAFLILFLFDAFFVFFSQTFFFGGDEFCDFVSEISIKFKLVQIRIQFYAGILDRIPDADPDPVM